jgi:hypothetical protein
MSQIPNSVSKDSSTLASARMVAEGEIVVIVCPGLTWRLLLIDAKS